MKRAIVLASADASAPVYEGVEIVEHETFVRVSWRTRDGSAARQAYTELNLARLRARARQLRTESAADPSGEREERLRTLGQELENRAFQTIGDELPTPGTGTRHAT